MCLFNPAGEKKGLEITVCIVKLSDRVQSSSQFDFDHALKFFLLLTTGAESFTSCAKTLCY